MAGIFSAIGSLFGIGGAAASNVSQRIALGEMQALQQAEVQADIGYSKQATANRMANAQVANESANIALAASGYAYKYQMQNQAWLSNINARKAVADSFMKALG